MKTVQSIVLLAAVTIASGGTSAAQSAPADARWAPWLGCWVVSEESVEDGARLLATAAGASGSTAPSAARVCVTPAEGGVTITTMANDKPLLTDTVIADRGQRPVAEPGCRGWQRAEWSTLGSRVFAQAEIACGDAPTRNVFGLSALAAGPLWLDIQMIESEGRKSLRVRRYRKVTSPADTSARSIASAPVGKQLTLADIKEAAQKVPTEVLQAAVLDLGRGGYDLKARELRDLHAAGVPEPVLDLMVAMSFPKRFVVERASSGGGGSGNMWDPTADMWPYMAMWPHGGLWPYHSDLFWVSRMYSPFYSTYYSPFGYHYWGYFSPEYFRYHHDPAFVVLTPGTTSVGGGTAEPTGEGRVVDGRGYTRIRRVEPATPTRVNGGEGGWSTAAAGSGNAGGTSGVTSGGYSSGGASGGGERVAVPRPPGS
jgi:hypothetical protein